MKWTKVNPYCIRAGEYQITKFTLGGEDLYLVYHQGEQIGNARDGNAARKVAIKHSDKQGVES
ncbi:hypothetical protein [Modicisalibacter coralii]|uniref:hypothetical protein n=1 Tax=Modicisalibacter coralii TaxID=2304602 RepID=UPI00100A718D|nr:hypothetical protein [Halomonas coralii]